MQQSVEQSDQLVMQLVADTKLQVEASIAKAQSVAIMVFIISGIIVLTLVYLTSRSIIVPVERIYQSINKIRRNNDLTVTIEQIGNDEITIMSKDFNSLIGDFNTKLTLERESEICRNRILWLVKSTRRKKKHTHLIE